MKQETAKGWQTLADVMSVAFPIFGAVGIVGGWAVALEFYSFSWVHFLGGLSVGLLCFGFAVVMRVCALYLSRHADE